MMLNNNDTLVDVIPSTAKQITRYFWYNAKYSQSCNPYQTKKYQMFTQLILKNLGLYPVINFKRFSIQSFALTLSIFKLEKYFVKQIRISPEIDC